METRCKEEAYNEVLAILDTMQEEPVSEDLEEAAHKYANIRMSNYETAFYAFMSGAKWQKAKDEFTTEDLGEYINELSKQFPEVSFAKLSRIAVRVAKWQKQKYSIVGEDFEKASEEWIRPQLDKSYADYGETKMMELTRFDGYAMLDAIEFCAKWKEQQFEKERLKHCDELTKEQAQIESNFVTQHLKKNNRTPTFIDAIEYGMKMQKEQIMANTADAVIGLPYENKDGGYTHLMDVSRPLPVGNNKIAIIFKENNL
jgi:hypothetical protein